MPTRTQRLLSVQALAFCMAVSAVSLTYGQFGPDPGAQDDEPKVLEPPKLPDPPEAKRLAKEDRVYEALASKYFQHYAYVGAAMKNMGNRDYQLWDETDGFFYDVLRYPDGRYRKLRVRSLVGLIPLFAVERLEEAWIEPFKEFRANFDWFMKNRPDLVRNVVHTIDRNGQRTHVLTILDQDQICGITERIWDPNEFLSEYGIRSLSKAHLTEPFVFDQSVVSY